MKRLEDQEK